MSVEPREWNYPLTYRLGASRRLGGIEIYHDFDWFKMFHHKRSVFPRGHSLSELVRRDCPNGKHATLLLTEQDGVTDDIRETADRYIVVVPIHDYLRNAGADAASSYYARRSATPLTRLASLADVTFSSAELKGFLEKNLTQRVLARWAERSPERMDALIEIAGEYNVTSPADTIDAIRSLAVMDTGVLDAVVEYLHRFDDDTGIHDFLSRLTQSVDGRVVTANVLVERLTERISDTREQLRAYNQLINTPGATETDVQQFLESNPWIMGLSYVRTRGRVKIPRGEIDFVLDRYDGFFDIVELKCPDDVIIKERSDSGAERPPSASAYTLGPALSGALAQAHHYRSILDQGRDLHEQYGLADSRQPRILILIGRSTDMSNSGREILRQLNLSLHRVEVIPYDLLGRRTGGFLDNIETLLVESGAPNNALRT